MKKITLYIFGFLLYNVVIFYLGWNLYSFLQDVLYVHAPIIFSIIWLLITYGMFIGRISHKLDFFTVISYYWFAFLQYGLLIFPIVNLIIWLTKDSLQIGIEIAAAILMLAIFIFGIYNAYSPVVRKQKIIIPNSKRAGEQMIIVVASDFHFGPVMGKGQLEKFVALSNAQRPDLVLLAGDLVDDVPYWYVKHQMKEQMKQLTAKFGVYGILGNHEYYGKQIKETVEQMEQSNITMLLDETIEIPNVCVLTGREDVTNDSRKSLQDLQKTSELPWFIMDHTPKDIDTPTQLGANLQVSGHTHLGQLWPNQFITRRIFPLDYGYLQKEQLHAITSSGFGFWGPPLRTNSRAELWVIDVEFTDLPNKKAHYGAIASPLDVG